MSDFERVEEAINQTRIKMLEADRRGDPLNAHDVFAILAAELKQVKDK